MGKKNNSRKITVIEQQKEQAVLCATHICCSFGYNSETFGMKFIEWKWKKKEMCTQDKTLLGLDGLRSMFIEESYQPFHAHTSTIT